MLDVRECKVEGWKAIAGAIGVNERTARRYAKRREDPLPVYWRRQGGSVVAHATGLRDWVARQEIPLGMRESCRG